MGASCGKRGSQDVGARNAFCLQRGAVIVAVWGTGCGTRMLLASLHFVRCGVCCVC